MPNPVKIFGYIKCHSSSSSRPVKSPSSSIRYNCADLLTVVSDRIGRAFNRSGASQAVTIDISKAFDRIWHAVLLHKLKSYGLSGRFLALFLLFSVIDGLEWFWMKSLLKNFQLMLEFLKAPFLGPTPFLLYINDLNDNVICDTVIYANDTTLSVIRHLICGNNLNWSLNLNLNKILWTWVRSGLLISVLGKLSWFRLMGLITMVLLV